MGPKIGILLSLPRPVIPLTLRRATPPQNLHYLPLPPPPATTHIEVYRSPSPPFTLLRRVAPRNLLSSLLPRRSPSFVRPTTPIPVSIIPIPACHHRTQGSAVAAAFVFVIQPRLHNIRHPCGVHQRNYGPLRRGGFWVDQCGQRRAGASVGSVSRLTAKGALIAHISCPGALPQSRRRCLPAHI